MEKHVDIVLSVQAVVEEVRWFGSRECKHISYERGGDSVNHWHVTEEENDGDDGDGAGCVFFRLLLLLFYHLQGDTM